MELPPELRLNVYEILLVDARERDEDGLVKDRNDEPDRSRLHVAVLRTSKQIYSEARPVLYQKNKFSARIVYALKTPNWSHPIVGCTCRIMRPGKRFSFFERTFTSRHSPSLSRLFQHPVTGMLRSLTHLTIDLSLATPGDDESDEYVPKARDAIACLCLSLSGASKMKEFARILWPLVFLRTDIVVKFEGIDELLETSTAHPKKASHAEATYGRHIAQIRERCVEEIEKHGSDLAGLRSVEAALASMNYLLHQQV